MHFRPLDEFQLPKILNTLGPVTVVITTTLLDELERQKLNNKNSGLRDRADRALTRLRLWKREGNAISNEVQVLFRTQRHGRDLRALGLDADIGDDHLLAEILAAKETLPGRHVLVSADFGAELRAEAREIELVPPPEECRLPVPDATEKELKKIQSELQMLRARRPILSVGFKGGENHMKCSVVLPELTAESKVEEMVEIERRSLLLDVPESTYSDRFGVSAHYLAPMGGLGLTRDVVIRYNKEVEDHLLKYRDHLRQFRDIEMDLIARTLEIRLALGNEGSETASTVRIRIVAPTGIELSRKEPEMRRKPRAPTRPRGMNESAFQAFPTLPRNFLQPEPSPNVRGPWVTEGEPPAIEFQVESALHKETYDLPPFFLIYPTTGAMRSLSLTALVLSAQTPDWIETELNVILELL